MFMMDCKKRSHSSKGQPKAEQTVSVACNEFAWDLYQTLIKDDSVDNLILSPWSIETALDMVLLGAQNRTKTQMVDVLHVEDFAAGLLDKSMSESLRTLTRGDADYILHIANRLYAQQGFKLLKKYRKAIKKYYDAEVEPVDFSNEAETRQEINTWVEEQTESKIEDLIPFGLLTPATRLVLVNAIYFKGDWLHKFPKVNTKSGDFYINSTQKVKADMMFHEEDYKCGHSPSLKAKVLELPYEGKDLSMIILLPDDKDGLAELENNLMSGHLSSLHRCFKMRTKKTMVTLPKFKFEGSFNLKEVLVGLGMTDLFDVNMADLSGMDGTTSLVVSEVVHKAFINVDEEGSEAAAATAAIVKLRAMLPSDINEFKVDHPFLFLIREKTNKSILFLGRMVEPPEGNSDKMVEPPPIGTDRCVAQPHSPEGHQYGTVSPDAHISRCARISDVGDNVTRIKITYSHPPNIFDYQ